MYRLKHKMVIGFLLIFCFPCIGQHTLLTDTLPGNKLLADIDFLQKKVVSAHPSPFVYTSEADFMHKLDKLRELASRGMTRWEFYWQLIAVYHTLGDSHSLVSIEPLFQAYKSAGGWHLDLSVRRINNLVLVEHSRDSTLHRGTQLLSINGVSVNEMIDSLSRVMITEGHSTGIGEAFALRTLSRHLPFFVKIDSINSLEIIPPKDSVAVNHLMAGIGKETPTRTKKKSKRKRKLELWKEQEKEYVFKVVEDEVGYLKIPSFTAASSAFYQQFLKESFTTIDSADLPYLVIDLRGNTGGSLKRILDLMKYVGTDSSLVISNIVVKQSEFSRKLNRSPLPVRVILSFVKEQEGMLGLARAMSKTRLNQMDTVYFRPDVRNLPERFTGKQIFVLTDPLSASASALFAGAVQGQGIGRMVGEAPTGTVDGVWGQAHYFVLPNSKFRVRVSTLRFNFDNKFRYRAESLQPDVYAPNSVDDFLDKKDSQMEIILNTFVRGKEEELRK
jgi:C-terminal processing protease CtpA/Prc